MTAAVKRTGTGVFILIDRDDILDPEDHVAFHDALVRAAEPLWADRPWVIVDPAGRYAATPTTKPLTPRENP